MAVGTSLAAAACFGTRAVAVGTAHVFANLELLGRSRGYLLQRQLHLQAQVGTAELCRLSAASSSEATETASSAEHVAEHREDVVHGEPSAEASSEAAHARSVEAELVILLSLLRVVEINIPAGVAEGMVVNVPGKGNAGRHNGVNGDIQVFIEEEPNDTFIRDGNNLLYNLLLDFPTAALGGTVDIPTIEGNTVKIKIEPGTQPGKTLRLRDKGLDPVRGYGNEKGDLIVNISVYVPKTLSKEEKKAVEQFKESDNFKGDSQTKRSIFERFKNYFN